jgi:hypothetical protein
MRRRRIESLERFEFIVAWWLQERGAFDYFDPARAACA